MKKKDFWVKANISFFSLVLSVYSFAASPKFEILLTQSPPSTMNANGLAIAKYIVKNNTSLTRTLTMVPVKGVNQLTGLVAGPKACSYPFTLEPGGSCQLVLQIVGADLFKAELLLAPEICKIMGPGDNRPDPFLCSKALPGSETYISAKGPLLATTISVVPSTLTFSALVGGTVQVTNTSSAVATVRHVTAQVLPENFYVSASTCPETLLPHDSCSITFNTEDATAGNAVAKVSGINTNVVILHLTSILAELCVISSQTSLCDFNPSQGFVVGNRTKVLIKNISPMGAIAKNVTALLPSDSPIHVVDNNCPPFLNPGAFCEITFNSFAVGGAVASIRGDNTLGERSLNLLAYLAQIHTLDPSFTMKVYGLGFAYVVNFSTGTAINVQAQIPPGSGISVVHTNCPVLLGPQGQCFIGFTASKVEDVIIPISGFNTSTAYVNIKAEPQFLRKTAPFSTELETLENKENGATLKDSVHTRQSTEKMELNTDKKGDDQLKISPSFATISMDEGARTSFKITNITQSQTLNDINIELPKDWTQVYKEVDPKCKTLKPQETCIIHLNADAYYSPQDVFIKDGNQLKMKVGLAFLVQGGLVFDMQEGQTKVLSEDEVSSCPDYRGGGFNDWTLASQTEQDQITKSLVSFHLIEELEKSLKTSEPKQKNPHLRCVRRF